MVAPNQSSDEVLALATAKAKELSTEAFRVRVERKIGNMPQLIATLEDVTLNQLASPESWLPALVGGGELLLRVYTPGDGAPIGGPIRVPIANMEGHEPDLAVVRRPSWTGPTVISFPKADDLRRAAAAAPTAIAMPLPPPGASSTTPPPVPAGLQGVAFSQDPSFVAWQMENERKREQREVQLQKLVQDQQIALQRAQDEAREEKRLRDIEASESRHRQEISEQQRRHDSEMLSLRAEIAKLAVVQQQPAPQPAPSVPWDKIAALALPLVQVQMTQAHEMRLAMLRREQETAAALAARPAVDPAVQAMFNQMQGILEKVKNEDPTAAFMPRITESFGNVMELMTRAMQMSAEAGLGGQQQGEPVWAKVVGEVGKALSELMRGYEASVRDRALQQQPQQPSLPAAYEAAATAGQPPMLPGQAPAAAAPQPVVPPPPPPRVVTPMDNIDAMVKAKTDPSSIAANFVRLLKDGEPSVNGVIEAVAGDFDRLPERWRQADPTWVRDVLMPAINREGERAGLFAEPPPPVPEPPAPAPA